MRARALPSHKSLSFCILFFSLMSTFLGAQNGYDFSKPKRIIRLPPSLKEISGLVALGEDRFACVQDEKGLLFIFNAASGQIESKERFAADGDFEALAIIDKTAFALRSDAKLFEIRDYASAKPRVISHVLSLKAADSEGLCADLRSRRLLIAPKSNIKGGKDERNTRVVFAYDIDSSRLIAQPLYRFSMDSLTAFAAGPRPPSTKKKEKKPKLPGLKMRISAIALHPLDGRLFILSALDWKLLILNPDGAFHSLHSLDPRLFSKPEGMSFLPDGRLYISNEGLGEKANLLEFMPN